MLGCVRAGHWFRQEASDFFLCVREVYWKQS
uniref:Uncharacterized protein n=1 Tax=Anguilla anguilla TaxID=7936 RepID=A0A0E9V351_ANGAN